MNKPDIYINPDILKGNISLIINDSNAIIKTVNEIYKNIYKLVDDEVWKSPEKPIILNQLIPYLEKMKNSTNYDLNNYVRVLKENFNDYVKNEELLNNEAQNLPS